MADVLVIGGNGFLGSHIVDALAARGHRITAFDMYSGEVHWDAPGVAVFDGNFLNTGDLRQAVRGHDVVLHMLSTTDPATAENDPTLDIRTNILGSVELFEICAQEGVEHLYFASSGGTIYGDREQGRFHEDDPTLPVSPYGIGKLAIENYMRFFERKHALASTSLRIANPYGTRQNPHKRQGIIPIFLRNALHGEPLTVMGDGTMYRDYIYVNDLASIVAAVVTQGATGHTYNLGSGQATSVNEIVDSIRRVTGLDPRVEHRPTPPTYVHGSVLDTTRITEEFGPFTLTPLDQGIDKTWQEIRAHGS
ncbi:NAD-dependent epimerase/dehydratase family protein [Actinomyces sp. B33]|uniref:NAD-dependent epimerase/dehydratase family protein n=1 Tax=Actinomyces sp. B33 TaxID=2942131 RepID=UPI0023411C3E|nr:NAD-dependent epimerase/dehydratase family protein [Actinomyces sp. B33]MDC4232652.1 NAD-dependent epimerase/dehydratase family protein [Actinomyces sp. B33]